MTDEIENNGTEIDVADKSRADSEQLGAELLHMQTELAAHGLTVVALLRSVAKNFHGVTIPVFEATKED